MTGAAAPILPRFFRLVAFDTVESTNDVARSLAAEGAVEGTVVWARTQTAGRGRRGRDWFSPAGNLYMSVVLRPPGPLSATAQLSFAAALAVHDAVRAVVPTETRVGLKWPNDVLVDGRKASGILLETADGGAGGGTALIVGIGVNVAAAPEAAMVPVTALANVGARTTASEMLAAVCAGLDRWHLRWRAAGFAPLRAAWLERALGLGDAITVRLPDRMLDGTFVDLDDDGALVLDQGDGRRRIGAGDVFFGRGG